MTMTTTMHTLMTTLLSQSTPDGPQRFRAIIRSFHDNRQGPGLLFAVLALFTLSLLAMWLFRRYQERHLRSRPMQTFNHLAAELGMTLADQWLLVRIARAENLPSPLTLLLSHATLHHHAHSYAQRLSPRRRARIRRTLHALTETLFGEAEAIRHDADDDGSNNTAGAA